MLKAGLDGIKRGINPPSPVDRNIFAMSEAELKSEGIESLPGNLMDAIEAMQADKVIADALGDHILSMYVEAKKKEWETYCSQVSRWEIDEYISKF